MVPAIIALAGVGVVTTTGAHKQLSALAPIPLKEEITTVAGSLGLRVAGNCDAATNPGILTIMRRTASRISDRTELFVEPGDVANCPDSIKKRVIDRYIANALADEPQRTKETECNLRRAANQAAKYVAE